jgi:CMP-N-acetylneuraminic acid synthetase
MSKNICIIPARGGSKRIPKKNIINFFDKPLIAWTIEAALKSKCFEKVVVSTDNEEIAEISKKFGAEVPFLREDKSDDISPVSEATIYTLKQLNVEYDIVVQLMANCPLRDAQEIQNSLARFCDRKINFQISSFKFGWMNPWWAVKASENGVPEPLFPEALKTRSQDLPDLFCPTGAIWIASAKHLIENNSFYGPHYEFCEIDWISAVDIDDQKDLEMARAAFLVKNRKFHET